MLIFPNCKINLGLHVVEKRSDGFHNLTTVFYPINWCDALEVLENKESDKPFCFSQSGLAIDGSFETNIIYKAWRLISSKKKLPNLKVHLHKNIPMGAGLGGGSSDAAHFINLVNKKFDLQFSSEDRKNMAAQLGSDCAFFLDNKAVFAQGKGDEFSAIHVDLSNYYLLLVYPNIHSNTQLAYANLTISPSSQDLKKSIENYPVKSWKDSLINDFESTVFEKYPELLVLKEKLYSEGALYASMSGSGSTVFGIFEQQPKINLPENYNVYLQKPQPPVL